MDPQHPYTLHVYPELIQLPSMVLGPLLQGYKGLTPKDFDLTLDSGPVFHPLRTRLEGDDPLSVTILVDDEGGLGTELLRNLIADAPQISPDLFHSRDHVLVAMVDCRAVHSLRLASTSISGMLDGLKTVLDASSPTSDGGATPACKGHVRLWDVVGALAGRMHDTPGRRVLLVIADGKDAGSQNTWEIVRQYANYYAITILGIQPHGLDDESVAHGGLNYINDRENPFGLICSGTGGLVLKANVATVWTQFQRAISLLRERYILDFKRPANGSEGLHQIDLSVTDKRAIVRISGVGVPLEDAKLLGDPSTVPTDRSQAPVLGNRKILDKPK